jgi:hypothetical protein
MEKILHTVNCRIGLESKTRNFVLVVFAVMACGSAKADGLFYNNITDKDVEGIVQDIGGLIHHTPVSGAKSLGSVFGFELGLIANYAKTPNLEDTVKREDPDADVAALPSAGILAMVSIPFGITGEATVLPDTKFGDTDISITGIGLKWTLTQSLLPLPIDIALRANYTKATISSEQEVQNIPAKVELEETVTSYGIVVSKDLLIVEPYVGASAVSAEGKMAVSGSNEFFTFTDEQSVKKDVSGTHVYGGANLKLGFFRLGAEAGKIFDSTKMSVKLSFSF